MWMNVIQSPEGLKRVTSWTKREFCQQMSNGLELKPFPESPQIRSDQIRSVAQSCPTVYDPMNCSTPGLPVYHQLLEFTETHVHQVSDAIQPSHPLSSPSVFPFSFELQSFPASGSFQMSRLFASGGQSFNISPSSEYSGLISFRVD